jgi:hypothetical protein
VLSKIGGRASIELKIYLYELYIFLSDFSFCFPTFTPTPCVRWTTNHGSINQKIFQNELGALLWIRTPYIDAAILHRQPSQISIVPSIDSSTNFRWSVKAAQAGSLI